MLSQPGRPPPRLAGPAAPSLAAGPGQHQWQPARDPRAEAKPSSPRVHCCLDGGSRGWCAYAVLIAGQPLGRTLLTIVWRIVAKGRSWYQIWGQDPNFGTSKPSSDKCRSSWALRGWLRRAWPRNLAFGPLTQGDLGGGPRGHGMALGLTVTEAEFVLSLPVIDPRARPSAEPAPGAAFGGGRGLSPALLVAEVTRHALQARRIGSMLPWPSCTCSVAWRHARTPCGCAAHDGGEPASGGGGQRGNQHASLLHRRLRSAPSRVAGAARSPWRSAPSRVAGAARRQWRSAPSRVAGAARRQWRSAPSRVAGAARSPWRRSPPRVAGAARRRLRRASL
jgi:hypothetical protein